MYKQAIIVFSILCFLSIPTMIFAQNEEDSPPPEIDVAFDALAQRTNETISFQTIAAFSWESREFADASLGCATPGEVYTQVITPGYQFLIDYAGTTYEYRVEEDGNSAVLCDTYPAQSEQPTTTPTLPSTDDCGAYYEVQSGDILLDIAESCGTSVDAIMAVNPDIEDPSFIYAGQRLTIPTVDSPYNVSITPDAGPPGTEITLTASGLPVGARIEYGLGRFRSEYGVYGSREVGPTGTFSTTVTVPEGVDIGEEWVAVVVYQGEESISEIFQVSEMGVFTQAQIYLVALGDAGRSGIQVGCDDSLVPVTVDIPPTLDPLRPTLDVLLDIETRTYGQSGLINALYRSDLSVSAIGIQNGVATVELTGEINSGGICDLPRIEQQLRQTGLQFSDIDSMFILVNGQPLKDVLSAEGDR